jgi:hypothetical protein
MNDARRQKVFRIARKLMVGHSANPSWYYNNCIRLNNVLNNRPPFGNCTESFTRFNTETGGVRVL